MGQACWCTTFSATQRASQRQNEPQRVNPAFVANLAASYSGKTISNYLCGVRAWHLMHGLTWRVEKAEMDTMLRAAEKLTPPTSRRKQRRPYTPDYMGALRRQLNLEEPLDAAVYACLTTCFYASGRLGEFTVRRLDGFDSTKSVT